MPNHIKTYDTIVQASSFVLMGARDHKTNLAKVLSPLAGNCQWPSLAIMPVNYRNCRVCARACSDYFFITREKKKILITRLWRSFALEETHANKGVPELPPESGRYISFFFLSSFLLELPSVAHSIEHRTAKHRFRNLFVVIGNNSDYPTNNRIPKRIHGI